MARGTSEWALLAVGALLAACAHQQGNPEPGTEASTAFGVGEFGFFVHTKEGEVEVLHMEPNGVVIGMHGEVLGRVHGHTITDADDRPLAWVGDDLRVAIAGEPPGAYLDPRAASSSPASRSS